MSIRRWHSSVALALCVTAAAVVPAGPPLAVRQQKVLDKFLGTWRTTYKLPKAEWTPEPKEGSGTLTFTRMLGGQFLHEKGEHSDKTSNITLFTFDAERKTYRTWWFSSTGQTAESTGEWDEATRTFTWTSVGSAFPSMAQHRFTSEGTFDWQVIIRDSKDNVVFRMEGKAIRAK
jgi:hypothetical protein